MPRDEPVTTATFPLRSNSDTVVPSPSVRAGVPPLLHMTAVPPLLHMTGVPPLLHMTGVPPSLHMTGVPPLLHMTGVPPSCIYFARQLIGRSTTRQVEEETRDGSDQCCNRPDPRRRYRRADDQFTAGECIVGRCAQRPSRRRAASGGGPGRQSHRSDLCRPHLYRRRRHFRVRQAVEGRVGSRNPECARKQPQADYRRHSRHGARRRLRSGADVPLSRCGAVGKIRPAGNQARPHSRRRRHAASAATERGRECAQHYSFGHAVRRQAGARMGRHRHGRRGGKAARRSDGVRPQGDRHADAALQDPRPQRQDRGGARQAGNLRENPQGQCPQVPRLRSLEIGDAGGAGRGRSAVRRRHEARAPAVSRPRSVGAIARPALCVFCRAQGVESRRRARRHAGSADQESRRHRRRHHGRRHRDEFPQCRHPGDDRRDGAGRARPRPDDDPPQLREHRQERPADTSRRRNPDGASQPRPESRCLVRLRSDHRGGVREHGHQERRVPQARQGRQDRARSSRPTPPTSTSTRSPR